MEWMLDPGTMNPIVDGCVDEERAEAFESAILKFDDLLIRFPASDKVAGALLKTGMSFAALANKGDRKENLADAKLAFNQVIQRFPDSDEAKIARQQLAKVESQ